MEYKAYYKKEEVKITGKSNDLNLEVEHKTGYKEFVSLYEIEYLRNKN